MVIEMKNYHSKNIKPYLEDIINNLQKSDNWKNQLTIAIKFVSPKETDKGDEMRPKCDSIYDRQ